MTAPKQAKKATTNGPRTYAWPPTGEPELEVISVTSAISGGLPKPFLIGWAAKVTAERAVRDYELVGKMIESDERTALRHLKAARWDDAGGKADRGTIVHSAFEAFVAGEPLTSDDIADKLEEAKVPKGLRKATSGMVNALYEYLYNEEPEIHWSESTVYSRTHGYAGTADLIATTRVGDSRLPVILDVKTSKAVYDETALQLAAYARADFVGGDDGTEHPLLPDGAGPIEHGVVIRPQGNGKYERVTFALTDDVFDLFLACLQVAKLQPMLSRARRPN